MSDPHTRSVTLSVEEFRRQLLRRPTIPDDLLSQALNVTKKKLNAKRTKFFTHKGVVQSAIDVEDHSTQLAAADQIYSLAGVYARERDPAPGVPLVALEYDSARGVMRLVIGAAHGASSAPEEVIADAITPLNASDDAKTSGMTSDSLGLADGPPCLDGNPNESVPNDVIPFVPPMRHHPKGDGQWSRLTKPSAPLINKRENNGKTDGRSLPAATAQERAAFKMLIDEEVED
jgi:hypothetical protein